MDEPAQERCLPTILTRRGLARAMVRTDAWEDLTRPPADAYGRHSCRIAIVPPLSDGAQQSLVPFP